MKYRIDGPELMRLRKDLGYKQVDVAAGIDCSVSHLCLIENGKKSLSMRVLFNLAEFYGISPSALLHEIQEEI